MNLQTITSHHYLRYTLLIFQFLSFLFFSLSFNISIFFFKMVTKTICKYLYKSLLSAEHKNSLLFSNFFYLCILKTCSATQLQCCLGNTCSLNQLLFPLSPSMSLNTRRPFSILQVTYIFCSLLSTLSFGTYCPKRNHFPKQSKLADLVFPHKLSLINYPFSANLTT